MGETHYTNLSAESGTELANSLDSFVADRMHDYHERVEIMEVHYAIGQSTFLGSVYTQHSAIVKYRVGIRNGELA